MRDELFVLECFFLLYCVKITVAFLLNRTHTNYHVKHKMSLEFKIERTASFKKLMNVISRITPKINLECTIQGIKIHAMDESGESLIDMKIQRQMFRGYFCITNRVLGLDTKLFNKLLAIAKDHHTITIKHKIGTHVMNMLLKDSS